MIIVQSSIVSEDGEELGETVLFPGSRSVICASHWCVAKWQLLKLVMSGVICINVRRKRETKRDVGKSSRSLVKPKG